jgi:CubicO group peptidase (beta-lactamase class C family)
MRIKIVFAIILINCIHTILYGQNTFSISGDKIKKIDNYLNKCSDSTKFMGYILISTGENVFFEKGYGYSNIEERKPFTRSTIANICSTGKIFTACLIMKLVQENKIKLDDYIGLYFPFLPYGDKVTIRNLLTHTSGLTHYQENPDYGNFKTCIENLNFIKNQKLQFNPGQSTLYSTSGMIILGALLEKIYNKDFITILNEQILIPLEMNNTLSLNYEEALTLNNKNYNIALPYIKDKQNSIYIRQLSGADILLTPLSAGGQFSSVNDIYKFDLAFHSYKIINKKYVDLMSIKQSEWNHISFGLGCVIDNPETEYEAVGHGGCDNLYYNHFIKQNFTMILFTIEKYDDVFSKAKIIEKIIFDK